ncbi:ABC-F family ATP-binding cassette domain-containing protein [Clostridium folliculivorans]|uniref:ABC transporter ATP-binding protein n=1 Tax=Clostridium folliculivorans TaxID=2886038 RepID=A0A9W5Y7E5_9CLOT|nr:ABC-F family ATP-binding cassette domain-containing protein [Clostridium folliculivorans]GKU27832.1 ABC transporter ATP-binding protein [Clostridium folliculivorans]GKU32579.1 ABC transporter ATP-binding protein [Clostridium folliculivorans]
MNLLTIENVSKSYSEKKLFNNISFGINEGDKIGIIGVNGTGKTTFLKVVSGVEVPDEGKVVKGNSVRMEYLSQSPDFNPESTVLEQVFRGDTPLMKLIRQYEKAMESHTATGEEIMKLTSQMDSMNAWSIESDAKAILNKLGVLDFNAKVGNLSGGQRKRIALAAVLISPCDLLILDEPTNHLDNDTIDWLEQYLNKRKGALLMITHDRYFLDRVVNEIIELDKGNLYTYKGNYSEFLEKKVEREEMEFASEKKRQNLLRKELAWIRRGAKARSTKQKARIDRFEELSEQKLDIDNSKVEISVASTRLGKKVIEVNNISKSFGDRKLIDDFSYILLRDDRVGIIGPNGMGKSTLINIISGKLKPDSGDVEVGETVKIGAFSQETYHMDDSLRVIDYIREGAEFISNEEGYKLSASQMLERFKFPPADQWTPISKLSGGEKRRLYLLRVLMEAPNVLILDEPTNDLDIETLTILEDYLDEFPGAVISVSHDRYFLDRMATKIFSFEGNGKVVQYTGNYTDYKEDNRQKDINSSEEKNKKTVDKKAEAVDSNQGKKKERALKFSFKEQREYDEIDEVIAGIEEKISELESKINAASTNYSLLQELIAEKEETEKLLEEKMDRWVYLNDLAEKINEGK